MNKYHVQWTYTAEQDLETIIDFIAADSIDRALRILYKLRSKASSLVSMPERGRVVPELKQQGILIYREIVCKPWRIIYRISGQNVYVFGVIDSRRNIEDVLLDRLTR